MRVSLFATCLVDTFYPEIGEATVRLLRRLGCTVDFPPGQTCCGQPAWNSGHPDEAAQMAAALVAAFADSEYVVAPSGSCVGHIRPQLGAKVYELSEFLVRVRQVDLRALGARFDGTVAYHQSCHMTRELGVRQEPFILLEQIEGLRLKPLERAELCCGFGGTFSVKLPEVAVAMADDKLADIRATGADYLVGADAGCLMHLRGRMHRTGGGPEVLHLAQLLERATRPRKDKEGGR
jgi:L-lactate dehydrogenase complex protein LldE